MNLHIAEKQLAELNQRLRIVILQNVREEDGFDQEMLSEMNQITRQILSLKQFLNKQTDTLKIVCKNLNTPPLVKH